MGVRYSSGKAHSNLIASFRKGGVELALVVVARRCAMGMSVRALSDEERGKIERLARARTAPARLVQRAQIIERSSLGQAVPTIAEALGIGPPTVCRWVQRFN